MGRLMRRIDDGKLIDMLNVVASVCAEAGVEPKDMILPKRSHERYSRTYKTAIVALRVKGYSWLSIAEVTGKTHSTAIDKLNTWAMDFRHHADTKRTLRAAGFSEDELAAVDKIFYDRRTALESRSAIHTGEAAI